MGNTTVRQHYALATGQKLKKGGKVKNSIPSKGVNDSDGDDMKCGGKVAKKKKGGKC
jgi:hypothetical protein